MLGGKPIKLVEENVHIDPHEFGINRRFLRYDIKTTKKNETKKFKFLEDVKQSRHPS
jgi:hypothetical protein